jgi:hypothetical protein
VRYNEGDITTEERNARYQGASEDIEYAEKAAEESIRQQAMKKESEGTSARPEYQEKPIGWHILSPLAPGMLPPNHDPRLPQGLRQFQASAQQEAAQQAATFKRRCGLSSSSSNSDCERNTWAFGFKCT